MSILTQHKIPIVYEKIDITIIAAKTELSAELVILVSTYGYSALAELIQYIIGRDRGIPVVLSRIQGLQTKTWLELSIYG